MSQAVTIYTKRTCPFCVAARRLLAQKGVDYEEIAIDGQPDLRERMIEAAGGRHTVPQIFIGAQHIGGYDEMAALEREGVLDELLEGGSEGDTA